jgi:nucleoside phosphorylase
MYLPKLPDFEAKKALIIAPQPELNFLKAYFPLELITTYLGIRIFRRGNTLVCGPLFSAQMAGFLFELLARAKVRGVLFLGWGGALNKAFNKGELFVPTRAYSKLGLTKELHPKRRTFYPSGKLLGKLETELARLNLSYKKGAILSVDFPFPYEKGKELPKGVKADVLDMEASALFALGEYYSIEVAGLIFITDKVGELSQSLPENLQSLRQRLLPFLRSFIEKDA